MQRVAFVSTSGPGHFNTIHSLYLKTGDTCDARLYVVQYVDDTPVDLPYIVNVKALENRPSTSAFAFNKHRSGILLPSLLTHFDTFSPDLVVYDFFCLEAWDAALQLGLPSICSIPATLSAEATTTCSDAILPSDHMYYVWDFPRQLSIDPVKFLGPRFLTSPTYMVNIQLPAIYITFGTVIPKYPEFIPKMLELLRSIISECLEMVPKHTIVIFGLEQFSHISDDVLWMSNSSDLYQYMLQYRPDLLIFHGGGNTFTESRACDVKSLVFPFFGDQFETQKLAHPEIDTSILSVKESLQLALHQNIQRVDYYFVPHTPFSEDFSDFFKPGDLVFGQKLHRRVLQEKFPHIDLHLEKYCSFSELSGEYPAIADVYNDETINPDPDTPYGQRYRVYTDFKSRQNLDHINQDDHKLVYYCILLLKLTISYWNGKIHFVISDGLGPATTIELQHVLDNWHRYKRNIIFYNLEGKRIKKPEI